MKKEKLIIYLTIIFLIILIGIIICSALKRANTKLNGKIYIKISENFIPSTTYTLQINEDGKGTFNTCYTSTTVDNTDTDYEYEYELDFTKEELESIEFILMLNMRNRSCHTFN